MYIYFIRNKPGINLLLRYYLNYLFHLYKSTFRPVLLRSSDIPVLYTRLTLAPFTPGKENTVYGDSNWSKIRLNGLEI